MHCSRGGHDRIEMLLVEKSEGPGLPVLQCPICGREEKQYGRVASVRERLPQPPRKTPSHVDQTHEQQAAPRHVERSERLRRRPRLTPIRRPWDEVLDIVRCWWDGGDSARRLLDSIKEWWDGGEPIKVFFEMLSDFDSAEENTPRPLPAPKYIRKSVSLDRDRSELRVEDGPSMPFADVEVVIFRRRRNMGETRWRANMGVSRDDESMWIYEVFVRSSDLKTIIAEFGTRTGAEKCANELRDEIERG